MVTVVFCSLMVIYAPHLLLMGSIALQSLFPVKLLLPTDSHYLLLELHGRLACCNESSCPVLHFYIPGPWLTILDRGLPKLNFIHSCQFLIKCFVENCFEGTHHYHFHIGCHFIVVCRFTFENWFYLNSKECWRNFFLLLRVIKW